MKNNFLENYLSSNGIDLDFGLLLEKGNNDRKLLGITTAITIISKIPENERIEAVKQATSIVNEMQKIAKQVKSLKDIKRLNLELYTAPKPEADKPTEKETPKEEQEEQAWSLNRYFARG